MSTLIMLPLVFNISDFSNHFYAAKAVLTDSDGIYKIRHSSQLWLTTLHMNTFCINNMILSFTLQVKNNS